MTNASDKPLTIEAINGEIRISIGIEILKHAADLGPCYFGFYTEQIAWSGNDEALMRDIVRELEQETEGANPVHRLLDAAVEGAIESGTEGVKFSGDEEQS